MKWDEIILGKQACLRTSNVLTFSVLKIITFLKDSLFRSFLINITWANMMLDYMNLTVLFHPPLQSDSSRHSCSIKPSASAVSVWLWCDTVTFCSVLQLKHVAPVYSAPLSFLFNGALAHISFILTLTASLYISKEFLPAMQRFLLPPNNHPNMIKIRQVI